MHRKSFLIKDILERQQKTFSNLNDFGSSECIANNHESYLCKADTCNVYSSNSAWRFATNNCFSCINSIPANSTNSWPAVLCNSGNEKLVSLQNRCKDALFNSIYYNTQSIGQTFIDNFTAFETASDVLSNSSSLEVTESGNQPLVTCSMPSTTTVSTSSSSSTRKVRRNRTVFTELQLMGLERRFDSQKYLSTPDRAELARALGLTQLQVKTWYQNRRMKWKKQVMQGGCPIPPTKPKGRPKKNSIPSLGMNLDNSVGIIGVSHKTSNLQSLLQQNVVHSQPFPR